MNDYSPRWFGLDDRARFRAVLRYSEYRPAPPLDRYVDCYWALSGRAGGSRPEPVLPDGTIEVIFNLADAFENHRDDGTALRQPLSLVVGEITRPMLIASTGRVDIVGIRFRPGGAHPFLQLPLWELTDRWFALEELATDQERDVLTRLFDAGGEAARFLVLSEHLTCLLGVAGRLDRAVEGAVDLITKSGGWMPIDELAGRLGLSGRQLELRFKERVGIGPKLLARMVRFQRIFQALEARASRRWGRVAAECGYYDQAHLIRDFRQFTGQTPAAFFRDENLLAKLFTGMREV